MRRAFLPRRDHERIKDERETCREAGCEGASKNGRVQIVVLRGRGKLDRSALGRVRVHRIEMLEISRVFRRPHEGKRVVFLLIGQGWLSRNERQDKGEGNPFLNGHEPEEDGVSVGGNLVPHKAPFHLKILHAHKVLVQPQASSAPFASRNQANLPPISCTRINKLLVRLIRGKSCQCPQQVGRDFSRAY